MFKLKPRVNLSSSQLRSSAVFKISNFSNTVWNLNTEAEGETGSSCKAYSLYRLAIGVGNI